VGDKTVAIVVHKPSVCIQGVDAGDIRGKHAKKHALSPQHKQSVIDHIKSFAVVESHYCQKNTKKVVFRAWLEHFKDAWVLS